MNERWRERVGGVSEREEENSTSMEAEGSPLFSSSSLSLLASSVGFTPEPKSTSGGSVVTTESVLLPPLLSLGNTSTSNLSVSSRHSPPDL